MRKHKLNIGNFKEDENGNLTHYFPNGDNVLIYPYEKGYYAAYYKYGITSAPVESLETNIAKYQESEVFPGHQVLRGEAVQKAIELCNILTQQHYEES